MNYIFFMVSLAVVTTSLQASYMGRLSAVSRQVTKKIEELVASRKAQSLKSQIEDILKDTAQEAEVLEPLMQNASKGQARQSIHSTKSGLFGKAESVVIENIEINNHAAKGWAESFFEWLKNGGQKRVASVALTIGAGGGYAAGSYNNKQAPAQPQIIVVPALASQK